MIVLLHATTTFLSIQCIRNSGIQTCCDHLRVLFAEPYKCTSSQSWYPLVGHTASNTTAHIPSASTSQSTGHRQGRDRAEVLHDTTQRALSKYGPRETLPRYSECVGGGGERSARRLRRGAFLRASPLRLHASVVQSHAASIRLRRNRQEVPLFRSEACEKKI